MEKIEKEVTNVARVSEQVQKRKTKKVRNRSGHRVELIIDGKVVVFLPSKIVEVPDSFQIPNGLGLYVR